MARVGRYRNILRQKTTKKTVTTKTFRPGMAETEKLKAFANKKTLLKKESLKKICKLKELNITPKLLCQPQSIQALKDRKEKPERNIFECRYYPEQLQFPLQVMQVMVAA